MVRFFHHLVVLLAFLFLSACTPSEETPMPVKITALTPASGDITGGYKVTITGSGLNFIESVTFGSSACLISNSTASQIECTAPSALSAGSVSVTVKGKPGRSDTSSFTYILSAPTVTSISPDNGGLGGNTSVFITGTSFATGTTVSIGGTPCTDTNILSASIIECNTPPKAAGNYPLVVTNSNGESGTSPTNFTYNPFPTVTSVASPSPASGPSTGGMPVTITGTGFLSGMRIQIGSYLCGSVNVTSSTSASCVTGAGSAGTYSLSVVNRDLQGASLSSAFTYFNQPTVSSISPSAGALAGGTSVTIYGNYFTALTTASIGSIPCASVTYVSPTQINCVTPAQVAGTYPIVVANPGTQNYTWIPGYTFQAAPNPTSVSPVAGPLAGRVVVISGTQFLSPVTVSIGGTNCPVTSASGSTITCTAAAKAAGTYDIVVTNFDSQAGTLAGAYTYQVAPTISSVSPAAGPLAGGTSMTLTGTGFLVGATVSVGGAACSVTSVTSTSLVCTTSIASAGAKAVEITNPDGQSALLSDGFTYLAPPTVLTISPSSGALGGGTTLSITGTGFFPGATVDVGGAACSSVSVVSPTSITCLTPSRPAGTYDIMVSNSDLQSATSVAAYTYQPAPTVTSVTPGNGRSSGSDSVVVNGANFLMGAAVNFGGSTCNVVSITPTTINCNTTARTAGSVTVTVTNPDAQSGSLAAGYVYDPAPVVSSVTPDAGASAGGTAIVISGSNFVSGATVDIGPVPCTPVTFVDANTLNCTTAADSAGPKSVRVTNPDTQNNTLASGFTMYNPPTISSVSPTAGSISGGTAIVITGTNFVPTTSLTIGGVACATFAYVSSTTLNCTTPVRPAGAQTVLVTNPDGATATSTYTYRPAPTVTSLSVSNGPRSGGTLLTINGSDFISGVSVDFGGSPCTVSADTPTTITCTTTAHASGTVTVSVTNTDSQSGSLSSAFTFDPPPTVSSISPIIGLASGGTTLTVNGTNYISGASVSISGTACAVTATTSTSITCTTDAKAAGTYTLTVTNPDGQISNTYFAFSYLDPPSITGISPSGGALAGGTIITISGTNFVSGIQVTINGTACDSVTYVTSTSVNCITPAGSAGAATVVVTNVDGQSATNTTSFTYALGPAVSYVTPNLGPMGGGTSVDVIGTGFSPGATVTFGSNNAVGCTYNSALSITCPTPLSILSGGVSVTVTNPDTQSASLSTGFIYLPPPTITSISPNGGPATAGQAVTISGTNFVNGGSVTIGGTACTGVTFVSSTSLTCLAPSGVAGSSVNVVVTNPDGQTVTLSSGYTYRNAPTITSVSPSNGHFSGGTNVTITGTGFYTGTVIRFASYHCNSPVVVSATTITCTTSAAPTGNYTATAINADGQSGTSASTVYSYRSSPMISNITPNSSALAGGTMITVNGSGFFNGDIIAIDGTNCSASTWLSANQMRCTSPAKAAGTYALTVNSPDRTATLNNAVTYRAAPSVSSVTPPSGVQAGNTLITISGSNFLSGATVTVGGASCTSLTFVSATSLTCRTPSGSAGAQTLVITNPDSQTGSSSYTYTAIPIIAFQTGSSSPNPPNPDNYGSTTTNITHTFTVKNIGEGPTTGTLSVTISGTNAGAFLKGTDTCSGADLAVNASCTIQVTFLGAFLSSGSFSATLNVSALTTGGTTTNSLQGTVP
jgi:hypothetical protein